MLNRSPWLWASKQPGLVRVEGPEAVEFLHRLSSQDVVGMADHEVRPAAFLSPKGRLLALVQIARLGPACWLQTEAGLAPALHELLDRYHFSEKLALALPQPPGHLLVGAGAAAHVGLAPGKARAVAGGIALAWSQHGIEFAAWHSEDPLPGTPPATLAPADQELLRLLAGDLRHGVEFDETLLGPEAPIDAALSTTKGCYTGQEIVARIATYGHVNRRIVLLAWTGPAAAAQTAVVDPDDGEPVGRVLSAVAAGKAALALAIVPAPLAVVGTPLRVGDAAAQVVPFGPPAASTT